MRVIAIQYSIQYGFLSNGWVLKAFQHFRNYCQFLSYWSDHTAVRKSKPIRQIFSADLDHYIVAIMLMFICDFFLFTGLEDGMQ
jgi:hypothetical protein